MARRPEKPGERGRHRKRMTGTEADLAELRGDVEPPSPTHPGLLAQWAWNVLTDPEQRLTKRQRVALRRILLHSVETAESEVLERDAPDLVLASSVFRKSVDHELALEFCRRLVEKVPGRGEFWTELGQCEESLKRWPAARDAYQHAWQLLRRNGVWNEEAGCRLAGALLECREFDDAIALLTTLVENIPSASKAPELLRIATSGSIRV